eukprot:m.469901 g.469901  ORF g.469901 m.469901 type:complete len:317 (+) comp57092_c0_seq1:6-956(+)
MDVAEQADVLHSFDPLAVEKSEEVKPSVRRLPAVPGKLVELATPVRVAGSRHTQSLLDCTVLPHTPQYAPHADHEDDDVITLKPALAHASSGVEQSPATPPAHEPSATHPHTNPQEEVLILQIEIDDLRSKLAEERATNLEMTQVVENYSQTMSEMIEKENRAAGASAARLAALEQQVSSVRQEKTQVEIDLNKTEAAFSDLHKKYEKLKDLIENYKANESKLKAAVEQRNTAIAEATEKFAALKEHAEKKIEAANVEIAGVREQGKKDFVALSAKAKSAELKIAQLERQLDAKEKDNVELTAICDDLVKQLELAK